MAAPAARKFIDQQVLKQRGPQPKLEAFILGWSIAYWMRPVALCQIQSWVAGCVIRPERDLILPILRFP